MSSKTLNCCCLVDDRQIVWAQAFSVMPTSITKWMQPPVYRVGSVSELFTDIGIMQLVEQGKVSLDAPVTDYISDFHPQNPIFGKPITLRS